MKQERVLNILSEGSIAIPRLLIRHYKDLGLNEEEFMLLLHIYSAIDSGNTFPTPHELSELMTCSEIRCTEILQYLIQRDFIMIEEKAGLDLISESYSIRPLWEKLIQFLVKQDSKETQQVKEKEELNLYSLFEQEFGRPLSPIECETLTMWIDQDNHEILLIKAALREAVMSGKLNFRYIDRILFEWKKKGILTIEQAREQGLKFRNHQRSKQQPIQQQSSPSVPFYNWLES
ncbi:DnaD domain-containing protein [Bacillus sp. Marseille-P3661]|uniref:DnaD domain-containing protein n=1 Tax=Bacillus sp. Marseille-P3661 TaxID=1936234 RepID=UPI000C81CA48|nr:DnaD domain-containing protein [Bacillus sp. Marseille-P3661]